jgi:putative transposase
VICLSKDRKQLLEPEHKELSIRRQCEILGINRSNIYYVRKPIDTEQLKLIRVIDEVYTQYPFFGSRQMVSYLRPMGYDIGRSQVRSVYEKLGLRAAICPGPHTSKPHSEHKVYPYLLKDVEIVARNRVCPINCVNSRVSPINCVNSQIGIGSVQ